MESKAYKEGYDAWNNSIPYDCNPYEFIDEEGSESIEYLNDDSFWIGMMILSGLLNMYRQNFSPAPLPSLWRILSTLGAIVMGAAVLVFLGVQS